jgi:hypothetical protein
MDGIFVVIGVLRPTGCRKRESKGQTANGEVAEISDNPHGNLRNDRMFR